MWQARHRCDISALSVLKALIQSLTVAMIDRQVKEETPVRYEILYQPAFSLAVVSLERGEQIMAESGAMVSMSPTIKLEAKMSGGGVFGAIKSAVGGESLFRTTYT